MRAERAATVPPAASEQPVPKASRPSRPLRHSASAPFAAAPFIMARHPSSVKRSSHSSSAQRLHTLDGSRQAVPTSRLSRSSAHSEYGIETSGLTGKAMQALQEGERTSHSAPSNVQLPAAAAPATKAKAAGPTAGSVLPTVPAAPVINWSPNVLKCSESAMLISLAAEAAREAQEARSSKPHYICPISLRCR